MPLPLLGANVGAWWVVASVAYWLFLDVAVPLLVLAWSVAWAVLPVSPWGPGHGWLAGVVFPMAAMLIGGLSALYSHIYYHEHAEYLKTENKLRDSLETTHAVLWGPFHFWLMCLLSCGYRPRLRAELDAAERRWILRIERLTWSNWARNVQCRPQVACVPLTIDDLTEVVRRASMERRKLRLVGSGFNWSAFAATDDTLVFCERLNRVEIAPDRKTVWVDCGVTNRELNRALNAAGLQVPWNVLLETVRVAGIVTVGTHGSGKHTATMGDLVEAFDVIDANGDRRILSEETIGAEAMDAARLGLGAFGVIARIQLRIEPACRVLQSDRRMDVEEALNALPELLRQKDGVELFWFPFTRWVWVRTYQRTELPITHASGLRFLVRHFLDMTILVSAISLISRRFPSLLPAVMRRSASMLRFRDRVIPLTQALHFRRWVEVRRCLCVEVGFKADDKLENVRQAFKRTTRLVEEWSEKKRYPLDIAVNLRFTGPSRALLSPAYGPGLTCFIEALSMPQNPDWKAFTSDLCFMWLSDATALPHWAKQFEHLPGIDTFIRDRLGDRLTRFQNALRATEIDPNGMFANDLLRRCFLELPDGKTNTASLTAGAAGINR